ncbi:MAG TPA: tetratricopeptide repeat protein, partial [Pseudonocardiaceae bacterium]|nr:tetratricopeptide repeat protein [Pseudonocardiaceae bacterium]
MESAPEPVTPVRYQVDADHARGVQVGDHSVMVVNQVRAGVVWPVRVGVVPGRADGYVDRTVSDALDAATQSPGTVVLTQVLSGLGGVGKTQLAARYARQLWTDAAVDVIVWVPAGSTVSIVTSYAATATELFGAADLEPEQAARRLLAWLAGTDKRWLIVLDDLAVPGDLAGWWPPENPRGRVIVTTRYRGAALHGDGRVVVPVGVFTPPEAVAYLRAKFAGRPDLVQGDAGAVGLAEDLGYLPLALAQATAYMFNLDLPVGQYRARLADQRRSLAELVPDPAELPDEHRDTVAAAWSLSMERADRLSPVGVATPVLEIASVVASAGVPLAVFTSPAVVEYVSGVVGRLVDVEAVQAGLRVLHRLSLVTFPGPLHREVQVHGLVQRATRDRTVNGPGGIEEEAEEECVAGRGYRCVRAAADALVAVWPRIETDVDLTQALRANAEALAVVAGDRLWHPDGHLLLFRVGRSLGEAGLVKAATDYFAGLSEVAVDYLGSDHPDTLVSRNNLAHWRGEAGDAAGAAEAFEALLADQLRVLGPDHPDTLLTRNNLAFWRGRAGDAAGAAEAFEAVLIDRLRVLGPDHPDTLRSRNNLAHWRAEAGDAAGAAEAF